MNDDLKILSFAKRYWRMCSTKTREGEEKDMRTMKQGANIRNKGNPQKQK